MEQTKWKEYIRKPAFAAFAAALIGGYLIHQFALVNVMHNIDDIGNLPGGYGTGLSSGRWLLTVLGDGMQFLGGNRNLPYIRGLVFLVFAAMAAMLLVSVLEIRHRSFAGWIGLLVATFPTAAAVLVYRFTAGYYGLALLLAVLAAWVTDKKYGVILGSLCCALSLGIYQAYIPVTIGIFLLLLLQKALRGDTDVKHLILRGIRYGVVLCLGLLLYFLGLKICLWLYGSALTDYQGMDTMGQLALRDIPALVKEAFVGFCKFPLTNYCGLADSLVIKFTYILLGVSSGAMVLWLLVKRVKTMGTRLFVLLLCLLFPVAVNFLVIMAPNAWLYTTMVYAFVLVGCIPVVLWECVLEGADPSGKGTRWLSRGLGTLLAVLALSYGYMDNVNHTANYYFNRQVENYVSSIVTQIRMTEGFTPEKKWAMIGKIQDPLLGSPWEYEARYGGIFYPERTMNDEGRDNWFWNYVGYLPPTLDTESAMALAQTETVRQMPCWPSQGSIQVIEDIVVIKFGDLPQA